MTLASRLAEHENSSVPTSLEISELRRWAKGWADKLLESETGVIRESAAI
jgi:nitrogenase iron protein NifH